MCGQCCLRNTLWIGYLHSTQPHHMSKSVHVLKTVWLSLSRPKQVHASASPFFFLPLAPFFAPVNVGRRLEGAYLWDPAGRASNILQNQVEHLQHDLLLYLGWPKPHIYTPYMAIYLVISLPKIPHVHRIYIIWLTLAIFHLGWLWCQLVSKVSCGQSFKKIAAWGKY